MTQIISGHPQRFAACLALLTLMLSLSAAQGPVINYTFSEGSGTTTADVTGNGNSGTLVNGPVWTSGPSGGGGGLQFNGVNTYVSDANFNWTGGAVTIAFWNFVPAAPAASGHWTFFVGNNTTNRMGAICPDSDSNIYWDYGNPSGTGRLTFNYTPFIGKWTHVTLVSSGSGGTYNAIYLNGQLQVFSLSVDSPQVTISGLQLGHSGLDAIGTNHFNGTLSDFRIYNRVLSDAEIAAAAQLAPVASPETYATNAAGALSVPTPGVLSNDTDYNGVAITAVLDSTTANGTLALNANGSFTYTANTGFSGSDTFHYHALDSAGNASASTTVTIQVPGNASITSISPTAGTAGSVLTNVTLTGTGFQKSSASRPASITSFKGHDYSYFNTATNWAAANNNCSALGGHLVSITSAAENQFVYNLGGLTPAWIGFTDSVTEGTFLWVNGDAVTYTNWQAGYPNGGVAANDAQFSATGSGTWVDAAGTASLPYVCEFDSTVTPRVILVGASTIEGYNVRWNSATQLLFDINLTGAAGGKYFVELINPDGLVTVSNQLFSISPTRWHLTIPIPYAVPVTNTQTYSTAVPVASSGDASATVSYMELDATDTSANQRLYDCIALLHTNSTFDTTTHSAMMGAGQIARYTNYPLPTMNLFLRYDFENAIFDTDEPGNGTGTDLSRSTFAFDSTKTLWARIYTWRGDGNPGNTLTNVKLLVNMDSATMPGAYMTGNSQKTLQWTVSPAREAVAQKVYKASAAAGPFSLVTTINDNTTSSYQDLTMQNGATTYYKVVAQTTDGTPGADSNVLAVALPNTLQVTAMLPAPNSVQTSAVTSVTVTLSGAVNAAGVHAGSVKLVRAGPDGLFDTADDVVITPASLTVVGTNQIKLDLTGVSMPSDKYRLSLTNGTTNSSTSLYAYWPFDEGTGTTAADVSGNGHNLTLSNTTWTSGVSNGGLLFNGSNSVAMAGLNDLAVPWSLSCYVKRLDTTNNSMNLMSKNVAGNRIGIEEYNASKKVGFTRSGTADYKYNYSTPLNTWTELTYIATAGSTSLYVNGTLLGTISDSISLPLYYIGDTSNSFNGSLDDMRVYSRALSATEVYAANNGVSDLNGNALDGEFSGTFPSGDGLIGGNFVAQFQISLPGTTTAATQPAAVSYGTASTTLSANVASTVTVNSGTVTFQLKSGANNVGSPVGGTVTNGVASVTYVIPAGTTIGSYTVSVSYAGGNSFGNSADSSVSLTVSQAPLVVTPAATSRAYGSANPTFTGTLATVAAGDNITATYSSTASLTSVPGPYTITATLSDPNNRLPNYAVTLNTGTLTVTTAPLTVTPANLSRNYGSANPTLSGTITGLKNGDSITASYSTTAVQGSPFGTYPITATLSDPGNKLSNYALTQNSGTLTVNKVALSITANSASRMYGAANPAFSGSITGLVNGDNVTATYATAATPASAVSTYSIVPTPVDPGNVLGNYTLTATNGTLTVTKAPLSVSANNFLRAYGAANPAFTGTLTGVVNGDNITATYATAATVTSSVGTYPIVPTLLDPGSKLGNYLQTSTNGVLTISNATVLLVVTPDSYTRAYGDPNPTLTGMIVGLLNNDNITATYSTTAGILSAAGNYAINATLADPNNRLQNYTVNSNVGQLTVSKASLAVTGGSYSRVYGAANPTVSGTIVGFKNGDNITATYSIAATPGSSVGAYPVVPTLSDPGNKLANYNLTQTNGSLSVTAAPLIVTPGNG